MGRRSGGHKRRHIVDIGKIDAGPAWEAHPEEQEGWIEKAVGRRMGGGMTRGVGSECFWVDIGRVALHEGLQWRLVLSQQRSGGRDKYGACSIMLHL
jgi:hypothetical protein